MLFFNKSVIMIKDLSLLYGRGACKSYEESPSCIGQGA